MDFDHLDGQFDPNAETNVRCTVHVITMRYELNKPTIVTVELTSAAYFAEYNSMYPEVKYTYNIDTTEEQYFQRSLIEEMHLDYPTHCEIIQHFMRVIEEMKECSKTA